MNNIIKLYEERIKEDDLPYFEVDEYVDIILFYYEKNKLQLAFDAIDRSLSLFPENPTIVDLSANIFLVTGEDDEALQVVKRIECNELPHQLTSISVYLRHKMIEDAEKIMQPLIHDKKVPIEALWKVIVDYYNEGYENKAISYYEVMFKDQNHFDAMLLHCYVEYCTEQKQLERAIIQINKLIDKNPYATELWLELGNAFIQKREDQKALDAFETCLAINPNLVVAHNIVANLYEELDNFPKSIEHLKISSELDFEQGRSTFTLGELYMHELEYEKALTCFQTIVSFYKKDHPEIKATFKAEMLTDNFLNIATCYEQQEKNQEAFEAIEEAFHYVAPAKSDRLVNLLTVRKAIYAYLNEHTEVYNKLKPIIKELTNDDTLNDFKIEYNLCTLLALTERYGTLAEFLTKEVQKESHEEMTYEPIFMTFLAPYNTEKNIVKEQYQFYNSLGDNYWSYKMLLPRLKKQFEQIIEKYKPL